MQVAGGVALGERRPAEHPADGVAVDEDRVGRQRAVHDGRPEAPERGVVGRLLPAAQDRGRQVARVGRPADEFDHRVARLLGRLTRKSGVGDESGRQRVDRRDGESDGCREPVVRGQLVGAQHRAGNELGDDRPGVVDGGLADEGGHAEREARADARTHRPEGDEVGRLLGFGGLRARHPDDEVPIVGGEQLDGVERPVAASGVRAGGAHVEARHCRRGQRG